MNKLFVIALFFPASFLCNAQINSDIVFFQQIWGMEKQTIVEEYMQLSAEEADVFWGLYLEYEDERQEIGSERVLVIGEYVANYLSLTEEKASQLMKAAIKNNIAYQKLAKKTFNKMSKSLSPLTAAKFLQLENYLRIMIQLTIQEELPFIGELDGFVE